MTTLSCQGRPIQVRYNTSYVPTSERLGTVAMETQKLPRMPAQFKTRVHLVSGRYSL